MWLVAGLWHELVAAHFYSPGTEDAHEGILLILGAYLVLAGLMTAAYQRLYLAGAPIMEGAKLGAFIGVLWVFPHSLALAAAHGDPLLYVAQNSAWHVFEQGLGGAVIGAVAGWRSSPA